MSLLCRTICRFYDRKFYFIDIILRNELIVKFYPLDIKKFEKNTIKVMYHIIYCNININV